MCRQMKTVYRDIMFVTDIMDEGASSCAVICSILIHLTYRGLFEHLTQSLHYLKYTCFFSCSADGSTLYSICCVLAHSALL